MTASPAITVITDTQSSMQDSREDHPVRLRKSNNPVLVDQSSDRLAISPACTLDGLGTVYLSAIGRSGVRERLHAIVNRDKDTNPDKHKRDDTNDKLDHSLKMIRFFARGTSYLQHLVKSESEAALRGLGMDISAPCSGAVADTSPILVPCKHLDRTPVTEDDVSEKALVWADAFVYENNGRPEVLGKIWKWLSEAVTKDERLLALSQGIEPEVWAESLYRVVSSLVPDTIRRMEDMIPQDPCDGLLTVRMFREDPTGKSGIEGKEWYKLFDGPDTAAERSVTPAMKTALSEAMAHPPDAAAADAEAVVISGVSGHLADATDVGQASHFEMVFRFRANPNRPYKERFDAPTSWIETSSTVEAIRDVRQMRSIL